MVRVGIIGVGSIARGVHIPELLKIKDCKITAICDIDEKRLDMIGDELKIDKEHRFTDYKKLINCDEVDAVEICTPNYLHVPMAVEAVSKGKAVEIEKPIASTLEQTQMLKAAIKEQNVANMMCFSYRFFPATRYAKWIIDNKMIGDIISIDVAYLKSSAFMNGRRLDWRFIKEYAGMGVIGDLGVHLIDMTRYLVGNFKSVCGDTEIVIKERKKLNSEELAPVETDDYCSFLAKVGENIRANFVITRCAIGNANTIKFDVYGTDGVISFNLNDPEVLSVCIGEVDKESGGLHTVKVPARFKQTQEKTFIDAVNGKKEGHPDIYDGIECQKVVDAVLTSAEKKCWVEIK